MNVSLDGAITLTKREKEMFKQVPLLAAQIALHHPEAKPDAERINLGCKVVLDAVEKSDTESTA